MEACISVVINTLNEEKNLPYALRSVHTWVDEIIVVDMHSEDRTADVARAFDAKVYFQERTGFVEPAREFAFSQSSGRWILVLDADEIVPKPLSHRLLDIAKHASDIDAVKISRLNYLLGSPLLHTGWGPHQDKQLRFFRRGSVKPSATIHEPLRTAHSTRILELPSQPSYAIVHFNYVDTEHFIEKLNRYTSIEAQQAKSRREHATPPRAALRGIKQFLRCYLKLNGHRDGWRGFYLCAFMSFYRIAVAAKLQELSINGPREAVESRYRSVAENLVSEYEKTHSRGRKLGTEGPA